MTAATPWAADIGGTSRLSHPRRALTRRSRLVMVGGESGGRWLGGMDRLLRAHLLFPLVSQKLSTFIASENSADLRVPRDLILATASRAYRAGCRPRIFPRELSIRRLLVRRQCARPPAAAAMT